MKSIDDVRKELKSIKLTDAQITLIYLYYDEGYTLGLNDGLWSAVSMDGSHVGPEDAK